MTDPDRQRRAARGLPKDDIVGVLLDQHADIADLLEQLENSAGNQRRQSFAALVGLLQARGSADELVRAAIGDVDVPTSRSSDARRIRELVTSMSALDADSLEFSDMSEELIALVSATLVAEEAHEVSILARLPEDERRSVGARVLTRTGGSTRSRNV
jgi:hypothetical protein